MIPISQVKHGQDTKMSILTVMLKECLYHFLCSGHKGMNLQLLRLICQLLLLSLERDRLLQEENSEQQKLISFSELPFLGTSCTVTDRQSHILHLRLSLAHIPLRKMKHL